MLISAQGTVFFYESLITQVGEHLKSLVQNGNVDINAEVLRCGDSGLHNLTTTPQTAL